ncbi:MAG: hypothetical protein RSH52_07695 [Janthinobacterium sp.]|uniref:hypothetical protein n=1 Tax=Janthinobacterium sp. FT68W TaxID=2654255 RepID=UPI00186B3B1D|nr:hypothetical protein [Janthinobacterium sp. FT68W]
MPRRHATVPGRSPSTAPPSPRPGQQAPVLATVQGDMRDLASFIATRAVRLARAA